MKKRICLSLCMVLTAAAILTGCGKGGDYKKAMSMYENGQYEEAAAKFTELGDYEDSQDMVMACNYEAAKVLFDAGDYEEAKKAFAELGDYEKSPDYIKKNVITLGFCPPGRRIMRGRSPCSRQFLDFKDAQVKDQVRQQAADDPEIRPCAGSAGRQNLGLQRRLRHDPEQDQLHRRGGADQPGIL